MLVNSRDVYNNYPLNNEGMVASVYLIRILSSDAEADSEPNFIIDFTLLFN